MVSSNRSESVKDKIPWSGEIVSVQPRIRLMRSFDQRSHSYLGYSLTIKGTIAGEERIFIVGIGNGAQVRNQFQAGDLVSGRSEAVRDPRTEMAEYYKTSELRGVERRTKPQGSPPPWQGTPPELKVYRQRGHRRLETRTYGAKCKVCIWGCRMPVEMIIDHWNPSKKRYRFETFCYGPKSCSLYRAGPTRKVPGRHGMVWEEEDWVDEETVFHRAIDE